MKAFLLSLALGATIMVPVTSALAADLPPPPPVDDLRPANYDWTGVYGGVIWGAGGLEGHYDKYPDCDPNDPDSCDPLDPEMSGTGLFGGIIAGANWAMDDWLIGVEGDFSWGTQFGQNRDPAELTEMHFDSIATARVRGGMIHDNTLFYLTGGAAMVDTTMTGEIGNCGCYTDRDSAWVTGWTVGAGMEHAFTDSLHARLEYLYVSLPDQEYRLEDPNQFGGTVDMHFDNIHLFRAGLTYNFSM